MICQQCQRESLPGARYCPWCGREVQPRCQACNTVNPPGSNFCFSCGSRLASDGASTAASDPTPDLAAPPGMLACARCYQRNEPGSAYCFACGLPLDAGTAAGPGAASRLAAFSLGSPAGFWVRVLAYLIDGVVLTLAFAIAWPIISGESVTDYWESTDALAGGDLFSFGLNLVYYAGAIAIWSTTLGKRPFRMYVVRTDGSRVGFGRAVARYFAYFLSVFTLGIGFIMVGLRQDKRGLHDLVCDTVVIRR